MYALYIKIVVHVLMPLFFALDNFFKVSQQQQEEAEAEKKKMERDLDNLLLQKERYHLDPFMDYLLNSFTSRTDLEWRINVSPQ